MAFNLKEYKREWTLKNPEKVTANMTRYRLKIKSKALSIYGLECACCGEDDIGFLSIDHINGVGVKKRKEHGSGMNFYGILLKMEKQKDLQVLCYNCNLGRHKRNRTCPHKEEKMTISDALKVHRGL